MTTRDEKRRNQIARRLSRLEAMGDKRVEDASNSFKKHGTSQPLQVRKEFVYRPSAPSTPSYSDRKLPPPKERPPSTGLLSPRGNALRLELILLGIAQHRRAGAQFQNEFPLMPEEGTSWSHFIATPAQEKGSGLCAATPLSKKGRSLNSALDALADAGLIFYPNGTKARSKRKDFLLLDERDTSVADQRTYRVPGRGEPTVDLPPGFLRNGWVHVLEDTEIALLMMVACGIDSLTNSEGWKAIPASIRLSNYGLGRDAFSNAHPILSAMGLLEVQSIGRRNDGSVVDFEDEGALLHRLRLIDSGFEENSYHTAHAALLDLIQK